MTIIEIERLLSDAFRGGETCSRELRLTDEEHDFICAHYPASVSPIPGPMGEKAWYQIFLPAFTS